MVVLKAVLAGCLVVLTCPLPATAQPTPGAPPAPAPPAAQETIYNGEATSILGRSVTGPDGKTVGRIIDLLVDDLGQPRAAVIDVGGFMGIGNRHIAVAWRALRFTAEIAGPGKISLEMTAEQIVGTPEYKLVGKPVTVAAPPPPAAPPPVAAPATDAPTPDSPAGNTQAAAPPPAAPAPTAGPAPP